jgi:phosphoribosyl-AMP cyclohydrolase
VGGPKDQSYGAQTEEGMTDDSGIVDQGVGRHQERASIAKVSSEAIDSLRFGKDGLLPAIVQDTTDGTVLMLAYMDAEALRRTLTTRRTWFYSRSRQEYWCKGETSGNRQHVISVRYDCDGDAILVEVRQEGDGACHTGNRSCFYRYLLEEKGGSS